MGEHGAGCVLGQVNQCRKCAVKRHPIASASLLAMGPVALNCGPTGPRNQARGARIPGVAGPLARSHDQPASYVATFPHRRGPQGSGGTQGVTSDRHAFDHTQQMGQIGTLAVAFPAEGVTEQVAADPLIDLGGEHPVLEAVS
jgi:hypothetical protein